jgi:hypothetical protein
MQRRQFIKHSAIFSAPLIIPSHFLTSAENDLALFGVSGEFVNHARMGFGVEEIELI